VPQQQAWTCTQNKSWNGMVCGRTLAFLAAAVSTPSVHSRVSGFKLPSSWWRGRALGFILELRWDTMARHGVGCGGTMC
jgi:hypothetical protein